MNKEKLKIEALNRMKKLCLMKECIDAFVKKNEVWISEYFGFLYDLNSRPEIKKIIKEFEDKYNALVYHAILTRENSYTHLSLLYVSSDKKTWALDNEDIEKNHACCYDYNLTDPVLSEISGIGVKPAIGGLIRIY